MYVCCVCVKVCFVYRVEHKRLKLMYEYYVHKSISPDLVVEAMFQDKI